MMNHIRITDIPAEDLLKAAEADAADAHERVEQAEAALLREYRYHMLRAEELREFLQARGYGFPRDE